MSDQVKVILWCLPRSVSSALLKSINGVPDSKMIFELFTCLTLFGPDRDKGVDQEPPPNLPVTKTPAQLLQDPNSGFPSTICTSQWLKAHLTDGYPTERLVFAKEIITSFSGRYEALPESGYRHAFLIRTPAKVLPSWSSILREVGVIPNHGVEEFDKLPRWAVPEGKGYGEMCELYRYVMEKGLDTKPVIIDSDDLLRNPPDILAKFCSELGIPFDNSLLAWEAGVSCVDHWTVCDVLKGIICETESFGNFRRSTGFQAASVKQAERVPADIQRCIDISQPHYEQLYKLRLQ